tara:strand:- start:6319 stop:6543 length:225 start_codon:yes stop_codon:yes gene_type:complete
MPKLVHYRKNCIGCNSCVEHSAKHWKISEKDGKSILIGSERKKEADVLEISEEERENNKKAMEDCPTNIIKIFD